MELLDLLKYFIVPALLAYAAYNERDKQTMRQVTQKTMPKEDIEKLIDLKLLVHQIEINEIKGDLARIENKLDKIVDLLNNK